MRRKLTLVLAFLGLLITGYLTVAHFIGKDVGCLVGAEDACRNVVSSSYSVFMGIPVALLGMLAYIGIFYILRRNKSDRERAAKQVSWFALLGVFAAGYFNWIMYSKLSTLCVWCEASHMIIITLFFVNSPWKLEKRLWIFGAFLLAGGLAAGLSHAPADDGLSDCLAEKGFMFYGAEWCPHCADQKDMLGGAKRVYIECSLPGGGQKEICKDAGIKSYPTWEFPNGTKETGIIQISRLKELSGC